MTWEIDLNYRNVISFISKSIQNCLTVFVVCFNSIVGEHDKHRALNVIEQQQVVHTSYRVPRKLWRIKLIIMIIDKEKKKN